jgi:hypothetical protein
VDCGEASCGGAVDCGEASCGGDEALAPFSFIIFFFVCFLPIFIIASHSLLFLDLFFYLKGKYNLYKYKNEKVQEKVQKNQRDTRSTLHQNQNH